MGLLTNSFSLPGGFNVTKGEPIDNRIVIDGISGVTALTNNTFYKGMIISDTETGEAYMLTGDTSNATDLSKWKRISSKEVDLNQIADGTSIVVTNGKLSAVLEGASVSNANIANTAKALSGFTISGKSGITVTNSENSFNVTINSATKDIIDKSITDVITAGTGFATNIVKNGHILQVTYSTAVTVSNAETADTAKSALTISSVTTGQVIGFEDAVKNIEVTNATNATNAANATKATQDGDGNVISTTYAKKSDLTSVYKIVSANVNALNDDSYVTGDTESSTVAPSTGDVVNIATEITYDGKTYPAGTNFVYTGSKWDALQGIVDTSGFVSKTEKINSAKTSDSATTALSAHSINWSEVVDKPSIPTSFTITPTQKDAGTADKNPKVVVPTMAAGSNGFTYSAKTVNYVSSADTAISATTANKDAKGNVIDETYLEKDEFQNALNALRQYPSKPTLPSATYTGKTNTTAVAKVGTNITWNAFLTGIDTTTPQMSTSTGKFNASYNNVTQPTPSSVTVNVSVTNWVNETATVSPAEVNTTEASYLDDLNTANWKVLEGENEIFIKYSYSYTNPSNTPKTNLDEPTTLTSKTDTTSAATWNTVYDAIGKTRVLKITGVYPIYTNLTNGVKVTTNPYGTSYPNVISGGTLSSNLVTTNEHLYSSLSTIIVEYPANKYLSENTDNIPRFKFATRKTIKKIEGRSVGGWTELDPIKYTIAKNQTVNGFTGYNVLTFEGTDYAENSAWLFTLA